MQIRQLTQRLGRSSQRLAVIVAATSLLALAVSQGAAQTTTDECPALVRTALDATENFCRGTGRNQICYGHSLLEVEPQPAVEDLAFEKQGDVVDALLMRALRVSAMNISNGYWGVALMRLQANLPDTLPGQNVTFLLFGDVEFTSAPAPSRTTSAIANQTLTIRTGPSTDNLPMHYLEVGEGVVATGRLTDGSWLRVRIPGEVSRDGWVVASLLTPVLGNFDDLDLVNPIDAPPSYGPLQAFYLKTGASQPECAEMPTSGLLIQTPSGAHDVSLVINDVEMRLGSTVFVQASPGKSMSVMTLEGMAHVSHEGEEQVAAPGAVVEIPVNESMHASGPPSRSKPYDSTAARALPVQVLDEPVIVPPPLPTEAVERINDLVEQGSPLCGVAGLPACGAGTAVPASATPTASQPPVEATAAALPTGTAVETTEEPTATATVTVTVTPAPSATPETTTAPTLPPVPSGTTAPSGSSLATPTTPTPTVGIIIASTPTPWATPTSTTTPGTPTRAATTTGIVATTTQTAGPLAASDAAATATPATSLTRAATTTSIVATSTPTPTPTPTPTTEIATI